VRYLGTRAAFFDPRDPRDTARVLLEAIRDPQKRAADVEVSRAALQRYDWSEVARQYLAVFERLCGKPFSSTER
jgi:glycosyltransferase involved in cell wall biosynthesis